jgi:plasmid replication initiation protein
MNDVTIYKSNNLIQASYRLSLLEQKIILNCIGQIRSDEAVTDEVMYRISVQDIAACTGIKADNLYKEVKESVLRLWRRDVRIPDPTSKKAKNKVVLTRWVQSIAYSDNNAEIELRFSKDILPYLSQLKEQFTKYKLKNVIQMKSTYGVRLYELLAQHKHFGSREISIDWLRKNFELEDKYKQMKDFKLRVIEPALKDINEKSDLWVKYSQLKTGRRVTHFIFHFGLKNKQTDALKDLSNTYIEKHSLPGESWDSARKRLSCSI